MSLASTLFSADATAVVLGLLALISIALYGLAVVATWRWLGRVGLPIDNRTAHWPRISVFKPLHGLDDGLRDNLESFVHHDYPDLELLCCSDDAANAAYAVAEQVRQQTGDLLLCTAPCDTANPKIANFEKLATAARGELVLLSDSNVRLRRGELRQLVAPFDDPLVGLVYQPVAGVGEQTAVAALENLWLTEQAGFLTIGAKCVLGIDVVNAKGMLIRRQALEDIGWFATVRDVHNDDHMLGAALQAAGWKLALQLPPATVVHSTWSWRSFMTRHLRHAAARFRLNRLLYVGELLGNPLLMALPCAFWLGATGWGLWLGLLAAKTLCEYVTSSRLRGAWFHPKYLPFIPLKDAIALAVWCAGPFCTRVDWRGRSYRIADQSRLEPLGAGDAENAALAEPPAADDNSTIPFPAGRRTA